MYNEASGYRKIRGISWLPLQLLACKKICALCTVSQSVSHLGRQGDNSLLVGVQRFGATQYRHFQAAPCRNPGPQYETLPPCKPWHLTQVV